MPRNGGKPPSERNIIRHEAAELIEARGTIQSPVCNECAKPGRFPKLCVRWESTESPSTKCGMCLLAMKPCVFGDTVVGRGDVCTRAHLERPQSRRTDNKMARTSETVPAQGREQDKGNQEKLLSASEVERYESAELVETNGDVMDARCRACQPTDAHAGRLCIRWLSKESPSESCGECIRNGERCLATHNVADEGEEDHELPKPKVKKTRRRYSREGYDEVSSASERSSEAEWTPVRRKKRKRLCRKRRNASDRNTGFHEDHRPLSSVDAAAKSKLDATTIVSPAPDHPERNLESAVADRPTVSPRQPPSTTTICVVINKTRKLQTQEVPSPQRAEPNGSTRDRPVRKSSQRTCR